MVSASIAGNLKEIQAPESNFFFISHALFLCSLSFNFGISKFKTLKLLEAKVYGKVR